MFDRNWIIAHEFELQIQFKEIRCVVKWCHNVEAVKVKDTQFKRKMMNEF